MPNHVHFIWQMHELNGKETAQGSFLKYTAHEFKKRLNGTELLNLYLVDANNKKHQFWQRDSLAIILYTKKVALQKLNYIHNNPLAPHWKLVDDPCLYHYSSAMYYERDIKQFDFLKDLWDVI